MPGSDSKPPVLASFEAGRRRSRVFTSTRVENMISLVLVIAVLVFGAQALVFAMMAPELPTPRSVQLAVGGSVDAGIVLLVLTFVPLVVVVVTGLLRRGLRTAAGVFAVVYIGALVVWPSSTGFQLGGQPGEPWIWYLLTVATACAAIAFPIVWAVAYTIGVPILFGLVRSIRPFGFRNIDVGILDALYGAIFGMVIVVLVVMFRQTARRVDAARDAALVRYDRAVRAHAIEAERVEVDALVHDNVLAALQAAERASGAEAERAAVQIAQHALTELREAGFDPAEDESSVTLKEMGGRLRIAAQMMEHDFQVESTAAAGAVVPQGVANAMGLAAVQAMVNSAEHAGGPAGAGAAAQVSRRVVVSNTRTTATIEVIDDGVGFDPAAVPTDRLGVRVSIVERMTAVGGDAQVRSAPGAGAVVVLRWSAEEARA
ncbi:sensor histidine kinase [Paramicrobacterium fandaimingii]|uniref:sensor histidine kinase n=1 Tax=Paramicrobacterium fandaimingii TaxID=2708079 RepID=UPI001420D893|nr:ATP-binding protein [Microbacterium fandaimingii]